MSRALNLLSNNIHGYGPSESSYLPYLGASRIECKTLKVKIISPNCSLRHLSILCNASSGGQRRNLNFSRQNRSGFSRSRIRQNEERDGSENLGESEFLSTKNGPLLSLSNSPKSQPTSSPGPREREIVELFRKVKSQLRERTTVKDEEEKFEAMKGQNKESETVDSLLKLLRKHSVEQGKRRVDFEDKNRSFLSSDDNTLISRPPSDFQRRSPVSRIKYEPIVSSEPESKPEPVPEPEFYSGFVDSEVDVEFPDTEEDKLNEEAVEDHHSEVKDLNAMKLAELRALAKARGMKGFSKLKKSELVGLLGEDSI